MANIKSNTCLNEVPKSKKGGICIAINLDILAIRIIVGAILISPVLWLSGRAIVGKEKAKFRDAIWIVIIGTVVGALFGAIFTGAIASIIQLILWLAIVKYFFDTGWLKAFAISLVAVVIFAVIALALAVIGFGIWAFT
jgi:hypothetical protein